MENNIKDWMQEWLDRIKEQESNEDIYTKIPNIGIFKNLKIVQGPFEEHGNSIDMSITLEYDSWNKFEL